MEDWFKCQITPLVKYRGHSMFLNFVSNNSYHYYTIISKCRIGVINDIGHACKQMF